MKKFSYLLFLGFLPFCFSFISTNVPLEHWSYPAIEKLVGQGLIDSALLGTKPFSRLEMARLIAEADEKATQASEKKQIILSILERLKTEFRTELSTIGALDGNPVDDFIKPLEDPYIKYLYADRPPDLENLRGDIYDKYSNFRFGFASRIRLFDSVALYIHPEYPYSSLDTDKDAEFIEAYGKIMLGPVEVQAGKDSLWWGPGYHGGMIMTNNAEPFRMIKFSNPQPIQLPWIFKAFGPFKAVFCLAELEKNRDISEAKLVGMRINFKPTPDLEMGLSRAIILGGESRPHLSPRDYWSIFWATNEDRPGKLDNNQLGGFDVSLQIPLDEQFPAKSVKLYTEWIGEDEASAAPSAWGQIYGIRLNDLLRTGRTDFIAEYANNHVSDNPNVFYTHHLYTSGYTYRGRIIGHHMGIDSRDLFFRINHYLNKDLILGFEYDRHRDGISSSLRQNTEIYALDLTWFTEGNWQLKAGCRHERQRNSDFVSGNNKNTNIFYATLTYDF
jgi:hypothetical protein